MYVVMNRLSVASEQAERLEHGFAHSAGRMREVPGCLNFSLLKEEGITGDTVYVALTQWADEAAFTAWTESESFHRAHANAGQSGAMGEVHRYTAIF
jgi:heme-degrading monooxygenase HmoA